MYLGVDLGDKKVGLAVFVETVVIPKEIVERVKIIKIIKNYINKYNIKIIVVGLPYDLYNKDLKQLNKTKKFINKLKDIFPKLKIEGFDERYTTWQANNISYNIRTEEVNVDDISAALILEDYIKTIVVKK